MLATIQTQRSVALALDSLQLQLHQGVDDIESVLALGAVNAPSADGSHKIGCHMRGEAGGSPVGAQAPLGPPARPVERLVFESEQVATAIFVERVSTRLRRCG